MENMELDHLLGTFGSVGDVPAPTLGGQMMAPAWELNKFPDMHIETLAAPVPDPAPATYAGNAAAVGRVPTWWDRVRDTLGAAQAAVFGPIQRLGRKAARAAGAGAQADGIGSALPFVLFLGLAGWLLYHFARKGAHRSVKL